MPAPHESPPEPEVHLGGESTPLMPPQPPFPPEPEVHPGGGATPLTLPEPPFPPTPPLAVVFWVVGAIEILAGFVLCAELWPGDPEKGYTWRTVAYTPALTWLATGVISGYLSWALALGLTYLKGIYLNTSPRTIPQARATGGDAVDLREET